MRQNIGKIMDKIGIPAFYGKEIFRELCHRIFYNE
jgi:hypothetical protein